MTRLYDLDGPVIDVLVEWPPPRVDVGAAALVADPSELSHRSNTSLGCGTLDATVGECSPVGQLVHARRRL